METRIPRLLVAGCLGLVLPAAAQAFCGTYVAGAGMVPRNHESRVVVARSGDATTLTMFNDVQVGDTVFGLVIPIPRAIDEDNVRILGAQVMSDLEAYTSPRLVQYSCDSWYGVDDGTGQVPTARVTVPPLPDAGDTGGAGDTGEAGDTAAGDSGDEGASDSGFTPSDDGSSDDGSGTGTDRADDDDDDLSLNIGCGGGGAEDPIHDTEVDTAAEWIDTGTGVIVDEWFTVGVYEAFVLKADSGAGLSAWLDAQGFTMPEATGVMLEEYVGPEARFLALRVVLDEPASDTVWLPPIQVGYISSSLRLPLRLGTVSSPGVQDVVAFFISDPGTGVMEPSNMGPSVAIPDECMLDADAREQFGGSYDRLWSDASGIPSDPEATVAAASAWTVEFAWDSGKCDPCPPDGPLSAEQVEALGFADAAWGWDLTRIRMRYTADGLAMDPVFYPTNLQEQRQQRYVQHLWELESALPTCFDPQPQDPGTCYTAAYWAKHAQGETGRVLYEEPDGCKHSYLSLLLLPLGLAAFRRRR